MLINASVYLPFPRSLVYATYRDQLLKVAAQMPNVKNLALKSRTEEAGVVKQVYEWHGKSDIPSLLKTFLSEDLLTWTEVSTWKEARFSTHWQIQPHAFKEAIVWNGVDRYLEESEGTRVESQGELSIDSHKLKGVPGFLSGQVARMAEEVLAKQADPNFMEMSRCVNAYLKQREGV